MLQRADTSVGPYRGGKRILYFGGIANVDCVQRAGHAPPLQNERSVTWRSDLFIDLTFTHKNMRTPGPGPQARCGKGVWSPEDQGDRCRVPRSFGPSGAGREPLKLLQSTQRDDHPTKGEHAAAAATPHPSAAPTPSPLGEGNRGPSKGKAKGVPPHEREERHLALRLAD